MSGWTTENMTQIDPMKPFLNCEIAGTKSK